MSGRDTHVLAHVALMVAFAVYAVVLAGGISALGWLVWFLLGWPMSEAQAPDLIQSAWLFAVSMAAFCGWLVAMIASYEVVKDIEPDTAIGQPATDNGSEA